MCDVLQLKQIYLMYYSLIKKYIFRILTPIVFIFACNVAVLPFNVYSRDAHCLFIDHDMPIRGL